MRKWLNARETNRKIALFLLIGCVAIVCGGIGIFAWMNWPAISDRAAAVFDPPTISREPYQTAEKWDATRYSETANRYEILMEYPNLKLETVNTAVTDYVNGLKTEFLAKVTGPARQTQPKGIKPRLKVFFNFYQIGNFAGIHLQAQSVSGGIEIETSRAFLFQKGQEGLLTAKDIFAADSRYFALLLSQLDDAWDREPAKPQEYSIDSLIETAGGQPNFFDTRLILTDSGVCVSIEGTLTGGTNLLLNEGYESFADCFKIALPEGLFPATEKPSRVINVRSDKVVALTFDDGPNKKYTPEILKILTQYHARATFFAVGYNVTKYPDVLKQIAEQGSEVGNHTQMHGSLTAVTPEAAAASVEALQVSVEAVIGSRPVLMRPPGGHITDALAEQIGLPVILWDVDPQDWRRRNAQKIASHIINNVRSGDIVLLHDIYQSTVDAMPIVLKELSAQGYEFVTVSELLNGRGNFAGKIVRNRRITAEESSALKTGTN